MKYERISAKIPAGDKEKVRGLVKKGMFESMTEFHQLAVRRLLRDLEEYAERKKEVKKKVLERPGDTTIKNMKEIARFVDELF